MNKKRFLGFVTVALIIGGTAYAIKKYKEKEEVEGEVITLADARAYVASNGPVYEDIPEVDGGGRKYTEAEVDAFIGRKYTEAEVDELIYNAKNKTARITPDEMEEIMDDARDEASWNSSFSVSEDKKEEVSELRYEANSLEARSQFIDMELAEWFKGDFSRGIMEQLFNRELEPTTAGDNITVSQIQDYRSEFFGESKWNSEVTMADLILHYARITDYNMGSGVRHWVEHFLEVSGLDDATVEEMNHIIDALNNHGHYCHPMDTYGLFGLTEYQLGEAQDVASRSIDGVLTYEIQYNIFLKEL